MSDDIRYKSPEQLGYQPRKGVPLDLHIGLWILGSMLFFLMLLAMGKRDDRARGITRASWFERDAAASRPSCGCPKRR